MTALKVVTLTTPDGVSREMRDTPGARKRIFDRFKEKNFINLAKEQGDWVLFEVAYLMMYDRDGNPPKDLTLGQLMEESSVASDSNELLAGIMSAVSNGARSKNELEALLKTAREALEREALTGLTSGVSVGSVSDSASESSGGATVGPSLTPESSATTNESAI